MAGEEDEGLVHEDFDQRRENPRFDVSGATLQYERPKLFTGTESLVEKDCPVIDMSRGGVRFRANTLLSMGMQVNLRISLPDDPSLVGFEAHVQGLCTGSPGPRLSNALDLFIGR